ncbi:MAG: RebB family R body protein [Nitrosomonas sp.]|nr:RebB family R body protein [Nitrosomonas sp.]
MADDSSEIVREQAESIAATNLKVLGDSPAFYTNLAMSNAVSNQQAMNQLNLAIVSKAAESILATDPREGGADIAALMQLIKAAQTTPPVTAG